MNLQEKLVLLAKRRGFFWPAYEIYGGVGGFYVLGPLGVMVRDRVIELWRRMFIRRNGFFEIESPVIAPYIVFEASGHVANFKDPMAECKNCKRKFRADHLLRDAAIEVPESTPLEKIRKMLNERVKCPECEVMNWDVRPFLTMFETRIGPYTESSGFLRPETAQGMFVEFKRLYEIGRGKLPIGIAQIGKGFRNEISPRQAMVRLREFNMMEVELFMDPEEGCPYFEEVKGVRLPLLTEEMVAKDEKEPFVVTVEEAVRKGLVKHPWLAYFLALSKIFVEKLGVPEERQRFKAKLEGERAHYSAQTFDHEVYLEGYGWIEVAGHAYRTDYDLSSHMEKSGEDMTVALPLREPIKKVVRKVEFDVEKLKELHPEDWKEILVSASKAKVEGGKVYVEGIQVKEGAYKIKEEEVMERVRKIVPHVVEPSFGVERLILTALTYAYRTKKDRVVLSLPPYLSPMDVAVFPLMNKDSLPEKAIEVKDMLDKAGFYTAYDDSGSIGRRYARVDEIGIPYAVTIDYQTLEDETVTVRDRDTWEQERVHIDKLVDYLKDKLYRE